MSKAYLSTDWHMGIYPIDLTKWSNLQLSYFKKQLIPYLMEHVKEGDIFIMLGDLFDNRTSVPILIQNRVEDLLISISNIIPIHLIVGNHDLWNKGDNSINSPKIFRHIPNIYIYESVETIEIDDTKLVLMPWVEHRPDMINQLKENPGDYLFCHSDLNGCRMHLSSIAHRNSDKIDVSEFKGYKKVFSGHIHIRQVQQNFEFIGAPYQMDRNDYNDVKGLTILDIESGETKFIENVVSPTFKKFKIEQDGDLMLMEHLNTDNHFVDIEINNSVLVGKRKNRKILETILGKKKFHSIEYINDLVKKNTEELPEMKDGADIEMSINDFDKTITNYTEIQEYENDTIKDGVIHELNNILTIYNKEYKFKSDN